MPPMYKGDGGSNAPERQALLEGTSDDDDFFLRGPSAQPGRVGPSRKHDPKVNRLQNQVDEVIEVMNDNIGRVLDRGERLEDLQDKSEDLSSTADTFRIKAKGLKNTMWWKECKMRILLASVILIVLLIIIVPIIIRLKKH